MEILDPISVNLNFEAIGEKLFVKRTGVWEPFQSAFEIAERSIAPKAAYSIRYVDERFEDGVVIDGVYFKSRVLLKNLENVGRVFPYVVTIGAVLGQESDALEDILVKYYLDCIGTVALSQAREYLEGELRARFAIKRMSFMSPGSLEDWPIEQQTLLFSFLEGVEQSIAVRLTENCLMIPKKSVSGIYFPTETTFYNCQLCPRTKCVGRKAAYSEELAKKYGIKKMQTEK